MCTTHIGNTGSLSHPVLQTTRTLLNARCDHSLAIELFLLPPVKNLVGYPRKGYSRVLLANITVYYSYRVFDGTQKVHVRL